MAAAAQGGAFTLTEVKGTNVQCMCFTTCEAYSFIAPDSMFSD